MGGAAAAAAAAAATWTCIAVVEFGGNGGIDTPPSVVDADVDSCCCWDAIKSWVMFCVPAACDGFPTFANICCVIILLLVFGVCEIVGVGTGTGVGTGAYADTGA